MMKKHTVQTTPVECLVPSKTNHMSKHDEPHVSRPGALQDENTKLDQEDPTNFERVDLIIGPKLVTACHPSKSPSDVVLSPGDIVNVLKSEIGSDDEEILFCQDSHGNEAWFPASVIAAQEVLRSFKSSSDCSDASKRQLSVAIGERLYHCSKADGWIYCVSTMTGEEGWVPEWTFTRLPYCPSSTPQTQKTKDLSVPEKSKAESNRMPQERPQQQRKTGCRSWGDLNSRPSKGGRTESQTAQSPPVKRKSDDSVKGCVRKVCWRTGMQVDQIEFYMKDGTVRTFGSHGGSDSFTARLAEDECITSVTQVERGKYLGGLVTFETSKGQHITIQGWLTTGKKWQTHTFTVDSGRQICNIGFEGSSLSFVEILPATGEGDPRRIVIGENNVRQNQSYQSAPPGKRSRRIPVGIPPQPELR